MAEEDDKLEEELRKRWDPERLSKFLSRHAGKAERLDASARAHYERRLGVDLGNVRIFTGTLAEEITRAHGAEALTVGDTGIILMRGSSHFDPRSAAGKALLAHELTHVAQAKPQAIHRRAVSDAPLATEASEAEAESVEEEVFQEETEGASQGADGERGAAGADPDRKEKLLARVLELYEEDLRLRQLRVG